jgi:hypothetical protein
LNPVAWEQETRARYEADDDRRLQIERIADQSPIGDRRLI